ncbi:MAG: hypothetical protein DSZ31_04795 [Gammaproteobacteria bacterium]|nr:MAG: hypothetical protein DSZ31_04795 [Gammaproteobacteria bacterium]RTZ67986.1 MAG: hypothetical protein DSZ30_04840 [Aquificaceae bacterium]
MLREWIEESKKDYEFVYELLKDHLAVQLKALMEKKGINKKELAKRMGVSPSYVTKIFSSENISLKTIAKVLVALEEEDLFLHLLPGVDTKKYELMKEIHIISKFQKESPKMEALNENEDFAVAA